MNTIHIDNISLFNCISYQFNKPNFKIKSSQIIS